MYTVAVVYGSYTLEYNCHIPRALLYRASGKHGKRERERERERKRKRTEKIVRSKSIYCQRSRWKFDASVLVMGEKCYHSQA